MNTSASCCNSHPVSSNPFKPLLSAVTAVGLLLVSQAVLAGGSHPHKWQIDATVIINNATTVTDSEGNTVVTDCFAKGELRLRSRWTSRCPPYRPSLGRWSDCPPAPWSPWWNLDDEGSIRISNSVSFPSPSNRYNRRYDIQYRPVQGQNQERIRYINLEDFLVTNYGTEDETWTMLGDPSNYLAGYDGVLRLPDTWRMDTSNLGSFVDTGVGFTNENCGDPVPIAPDDEGGGTSTFPITAAKDGKTDKKMYEVMEKVPSESSKKKMQAEHAERYREKRKQLLDEVARHVNQRPPSQKGKHKRLCTHIQLADGEKGIAVCGAKARKANPKLWEARLKLWEWDQRHPPEEELFEGGDKPAGPDGEPESKCHCGIVTFFNPDDGFQICEESVMWCSQCDPACD